MIELGCLQVGATSISSPLRETKSEAHVDPRFPETSLCQWTQKLLDLVTLLVHSQFYHDDFIINAAPREACDANEEDGELCG
jgi:hypothetical protein